jgi:hypothetical protein
MALSPRLRWLSIALLALSVLVLLLALAFFHWIDWSGLALSLRSSATLANRLWVSCCELHLSVLESAVIDGVAYRQADRLDFVSAFLLP